MSRPGANAMSKGWKQSQPRRSIACVKGACWPENRSKKRRGCCAGLRAGMGVRDLGCGVELCSVPGCDVALVLLMLGLREGCLSLTRGPAADTGGQGVLGECGLGSPKPSYLEGGMFPCVADSRGAGCGKGFGVLRGSPLLRSPCVCQVAGAAAGGSAALGLSACDLKRRWLAGCLCPQACPLARRMAQRCANLQLRSLHSVLLKRTQSVLFPCLSCRLRIASASAVTLPSSLRRVWTLPPPFLPLPLPGLPLPLPSFCMGGRARGCRSARTSALTHVISCSASSSVHPSACKPETSFQILRSACKSSCVFTVRRPVSAGSCCMQRSKIFLSNALRVARCAPLQSAIALRKICWARASHAG